MLKINPINPFHEGEIEAQTRAGAGDVARRVGGFIRSYLPEQHREFHTSLPFLIASSANSDGKVWITMIEGPDGFATSPDPEHLKLATKLDVADPLSDAFASGADIGVVGIELATRRRNRFSGHIHPTEHGYAIDIRQTFGNCPQNIHPRQLTRVSREGTAKAETSEALTQDQINRIKQADTMFIGSGHHGKSSEASTGFDASHRGGPPGFVHVVNENHLQVPDYAGNNFFNTIGNLLLDPRVGLLFVDFETGGLMHITGRAKVDWNPTAKHSPDAWRMIDVEIDRVVNRPAAVGLRWRKQDHLTRTLRLVRREMESKTITSFYLEPINGQSLNSFQAGQYLPIEVQIPGQVGTSKRSYSLSGSPDNPSQYRLSIKREESGLVSRHLHDNLQEGGLIKASKPAGRFVEPNNDCPLVLVSSGIGLTPMLSVLHANAQQSKRPVWYVHGARNGRDHALSNEVNALVSGNDLLQRLVFYSQPEADDQLGRNFDKTGRMSIDDLISLNAGPDAHYMLCGPTQFLTDIRLGLEEADIPAEQIHVETFGPQAQPQKTR